MFLHTYEVHAPYTPARRNLKPFDRDPREEDNRFADPAHAAAIERLRGLLEEALAARVAPKVEPMEVDARTRERLRALGYVE